jgi:hypothetical protein
MIGWEKIISQSPNAKRQTSVAGANVSLHQFSTRRKFSKKEKLRGVNNLLEVVICLS